MLLAICSDTHDNAANIETFLNYCNTIKIDQIIHCGDWTTPETITQFVDGFSGPIWGVYGNATISEKRFPTLNTELVHIYPQVIHRVINDVSIAVVHKPAEAKKLAISEKYDYICYGHTHKPWLEKVGTTTLFNPGTLGGMFTSATFATINTGSRDLKLLRLIDFSQLT